MEIIRKKININSLTGENSPSNYVFFKIFLTQTFDNIGEFTDLNFTPKEIVNRELSTLDKFFRIEGVDVRQWYVESGLIKGVTDSKIEEVRNYNASNPFIVDFNVDNETYTNFNGDLVNGVNRVTRLENGEIDYVLNTNLDNLIGSENQNSGIFYSEAYPNNPYSAPTNMMFYGEGWNQTNTSLSALYKEEYLMGIIFSPEVKNDIFIDRGNVNVMEKHLRMSEIENLNHLVNYNNGFFNIIKY